MLLLGKKERWNELKPVNYTIFCKLINTLFGPPCLIHLPIISHLKDQIFLGPFLPSTESTIHSHIFSHAISDGPGTPEHWISLCFRVTVNKLTAGQKADFLPFPAPHIVFSLPTNTIAFETLHIQELSKHKMLEHDLYKFVI